MHHLIHITVGFIDIHIYYGSVQVLLYDHIDKYHDMVHGQIRK